jgi:hypothetical protein
MAATKKFAKKSTGGKRYVSKKKVGRVSPKTARNFVSKRMKTIIAGEVQRALNSGVQNERRKVTMELVLPQEQIFINGKQMYYNCIRIPITDAIPAQAARRRRSNKFLVTGVNVRASFSVSDETRVMIVPYEPHESVKKYLDGVPLATEPSAAQGLVPERFATSLVPYQSMGLLSKHGPLMVKKHGDGIALDTVDGTVASPSDRSFARSLAEERCAGR